MKSWRELAKGRLSLYRPAVGGGAHPDRGRHPFLRMGTRPGTGCPGGTPSLDGNRCG